MHPIRFPASSTPLQRLPLWILREAAEKKLLDGFTTIGVSVHAANEALEAQSLGATYLTAGHIYATDCKKGLPPRGTAFLREICQTVSIPVGDDGALKRCHQWNFQSFTTICRFLFPLYSLMPG